ncbi:MAG: T9SS type A sorting domain-containing protein [Ignavibacteriaceae bacterium]|nr:T9SS type A sorting domain-containing protein [Ignavibacteriaceae bacterium]
MKKILLTTAIIVCLLNVKQYAQDSLQYFPYNAGDKWSYYVLDFNQGHYETITIDSVKSDSLGEIVYKSGDQMTSNRLVVDTTKAIVYASYFNSLDSTWQLLDLYHLKANVGDYWNVYRDTTKSNWFGVSASLDTNVFGVRKRVKTFEHFVGFYGGDTTGENTHDPTNWGSFLWEDYAYGVGMTHRGLEGGEDWYLIGTVLNKDTLGTIVSVKEISNNLPQKFDLLQNYPNPFNPTTIIEYQLPKGGFATLKIYDILGREVSTLVNGFRTQGKYSISFNASKLASGIYFYQLKSNGFSSIKKMILTK